MLEMSKCSCGTNQPYWVQKESSLWSLIFRTVTVWRCSNPLFVARQQSSVIMLPRLSSPQTRTVAFEVLSADTNMFTEIPCCYVSSKCHIWWQSKFSMKLIRGWQNLSSVTAREGFVTVAENSRLILTLLMPFTSGLLSSVKLWPSIWGRAMVDRSAWVCDGWSQRRPRRLALTWFFHILTFVSKCIFSSQR